MRVLGVDPGISNLGLAVVEGDARGARLLLARVITTRPHEPAADRVGRLFEGVRAAIEDTGPEALALEAQYFYRQNERAFQVGWGVGAVLAACHLAGIPAYAYGPMQVKKSLVGAGRAEKRQVAFMVRHYLKDPSLAGPSHLADAAAVALTHLFLPPPAREEHRL